MKMKKKIFFIAIIAIFLLTIILVLAKNKEGNNNIINKVSNDEIIEMVNNKSTLPVKYMSKYDSEDSNLKNYEYINNYMSNDYSNDDIRFSYYGYPNDESDYYLGKIIILNNKYNLLGVTVGDDIQQAISRLEENGFALDGESGRYTATLKNNDFTIELEATIEDEESSEINTAINLIKIEVNSEYLGNRLY